MKLLPLLACLLVASCATPETYTSTPMVEGGKNTSYAVDDHADGFTVSVLYSRYQYIPESNAVATAGKSALLSTAYEVAAKKGKRIEVINEQTIKQSMGRNGVAGITSYSGSVRAYFKK